MRPDSHHTRITTHTQQHLQQAASDTESSSTSGHSSGMEEAEVEEDGQAAQGGEQEQATQQQGASGGDGAAAVVTATQGGDAAAAAGDGETVIDGAPAVCCCRCGKYMLVQQHDHEYPTSPQGAPAAPQPAKRKAIADLYDYDDEWIDDSELIEYFGGDQRRAKHKGFFINRGDIEREDGPPKASPQAGGAGGAGRKRRRKEPGGDAGGEGSAQANAPPETPQVKKACGGGLWSIWVYGVGMGVWCWYGCMVLVWVYGVGVGVGVWVWYGNMDVWLVPEGWKIHIHSFARDIKK